MAGLIPRTRAAAQPAANATPKTTVVEADPSNEQEQGSTETATEVEESAAAPAAAPSVHTASKTTAVATRPTGSLAPMGLGRQVSPLEPMKNALGTLEWNALLRIQATNGNFVNQDDSNRPIGPEMEIQLLSYQDNWLISPGGQKDAPGSKEVVRYSDDGKFTTKGEDCEEYLRMLKQQWPEAKMSSRLVLGFLIVSAGEKGKALVDELAQINLAPTSVARFRRYNAKCLVDLQRGLLKPEDSAYIKMTCEPTTANGNTWTIVNFGYGARPA